MDSGKDRGYRLYLCALLNYLVIRLLFCEIPHFLARILRKTNRSWVWPGDVALANHKRARSSTLRHRRRMGMSVVQQGEGSRQEKGECIG